MERLKESFSCSLYVVVLLLLLMIHKAYHIKEGWSYVASHFLHTMYTYNVM